MNRLLGNWMLLCLASISQTALALENDVKYDFATRDYSIEMKVAFFDAYWGKRLAFSSDAQPGKGLRFSGAAGRTDQYIERFVGAAAVVRYSVKLANGGRPSLASIRELVTVSAQSADLPQRAPFSMTQKLVKGIGSDLQVFGYDEGPLKKAERIRTRQQAQRTWWRLCRQELYVDDETKPFAIVEWKHTLERISIVQIRASSKTSASNPARAVGLEVHVHNEAGLQTTMLARCMSQLRAVLVSAGASVNIRLCEREGALSCEPRSAGARVADLRILPGAGTKMKNIRRSILGQSVVNERGL